MAVILRRHLGDQARGDGAHGGAEDDASDILSKRTSRLVLEKKKSDGEGRHHILPLFFSSCSLFLSLFSKKNMRLLSGAVALARAATALALKEETIAAARTSATPPPTRASSIAAARPCFFSSSSSAAAWRFQQISLLWTQQQQQERTALPSCSRAASNSAASSSSSAAREGAAEEEKGADDSSTSSTSTKRASSSSSPAAPVPSVSYVAPLSTAVHRLKRLSLFSCLLTTAAAPTLAATESMPPAARATAAVGIAGFGLFTTGLLHWFVGPYVHELTWSYDDDATKDSIELTTLNVLGTKKKHSLPLSRVATPPDSSIHPQATFCDSESGKLYYIDVDNFVSVASEAGGGGRRQMERADTLLRRLVVVAQEEGKEAGAGGEAGGKE